MTDRVPDHPDFGYPSGQRDPALEAQARLGLSLFRGDGNAIYATDFNSEFLVNDWRVTAGAVALAGANLDGVIRGKSFIALTPSATLDRNCIIEKMFPYMDYGLLGLEATISLEPQVTQFWFQINVFDGTYKYEFYFRADYDFSRYYIGSMYLGNPSLISFLEPVPAGDDIRVSDSGGKFYLPANVKLVIDTNSLTYDGFYFNEKTFNLIGNLPTVYLDNSPRRISVEFGTFCANGTQKKMYVDSVFLTNNEISSRDRAEAQEITPVPYEEVTYNIVAGTQNVYGYATAYATARSTSAGFTNAPPLTNLSVGQGVGASPTSDPYGVGRCNVPFDTSIIPDSAIILQVNMIWQFARTTFVGSSTNFNFQLIQAALPSVVNNGNREAAYDAILAAGSPLVIGNTGTTPVNTPQVTANLPTNYINVTGFTVYGIRSSTDAAGTAPVPGPAYSFATLTAHPILSVKVLQPA